MWILPTRSRVTKPLDLGKVQVKLYHAIRASRFTADLEQACLGNKLGLKISTVRLKNKKSYCGAHPGPCPVEGGRRHRTGRWLEGADWVGFNALLNDVLDDMNAEAIVFSFNTESRGGSRYYIRRGAERRCNYPAVSNFTGFRTFTHWVDGGDECFVDCRGRKPPAPDFPEGTPGIPVYTLKEEAKRSKEHAHVEVSGL